MAEVIHQNMNGSNMVQSEPKAYMYSMLKFEVDQATATEELITNSVLCFLFPQDLLNCMLVNKQWYTMATQNNLWQDIAQRDGLPIDQYNPIKHFNWKHFYHCFMNPWELFATKKTRDCFELLDYQPSVAVPSEYMLRKPNFSQKELKLKQRLQWERENLELHKKKIAVERFSNELFRNPAVQTTRPMSKQSKLIEFAIIKNSFWVCVGVAEGVQSTRAFIEEGDNVLGNQVGCFNCGIYSAERSSFLYLNGSQYTHLNDQQIPLLKPGMKVSIQYLEEMGSKSIQFYLNHRRLGFPIEIPSHVSNIYPTISISYHSVISICNTHLHQLYVDEA